MAVCGASGLAAVTSTTGPSAGSATLAAAGLVVAIAGGALGRRHPFAGRVAGALAAPAGPIVAVLVLVAAWFGGGSLVWSATGEPTVPFALSDLVLSSLGVAAAAGRAHD